MAFVPSKQFGSYRVTSHQLLFLVAVDICEYLDDLLAFYPLGNC